MTRTILLARHGTHAEVGAVLSGRSEIALSDRGRAEAEGLAARLAAVTIASIHSSPRRRTQETAAIVARQVGLPVRVADALDEVDFGSFTGRSFAELDGVPAWFRWNAERATARCPGGETMGEAVERAWTYITAIAQTDAPALVVSHCDVIRGLVVRALGLPLDRIFQFDCDPASLTTLVFDDGGVRVSALNLAPL